MSTAIRSAHRVSAVVVLAALFFTAALITPNVSTAQSAWTNPFETPEEQQDEESPYGTRGTPQQDEDRNAWNTDDPWNTEDPWGLKERNRSYGESDWARDFYDFDDENESGENDSDKGSAERVGNGVTMNVAEGGKCEIGECDPGLVCCQAGNSNNNFCKTPDNCNSGGQTPIDCTEQTGNLPPECSTFCDDNPQQCDGTVIPLPGLVYLLLAGLGYSGYKLRDRHTA